MNELAAKWEKRQTGEISSPMYKLKHWFLNVRLPGDSLTGFLMISIKHNSSGHFEKHNKWNEQDPLQEKLSPPCCRSWMQRRKKVRPPQRIQWPWGDRDGAYRSNRQPLHWLFNSDSKNRDKKSRRFIHCKQALNTCPPNREVTHCEVFLEFSRKRAERCHLEVFLVLLGVISRILILFFKFQIIQHKQLVVCLGVGGI